MDEYEIRAAELVSEEAVDVQDVREDDPIGFAIVEPEGGPRFGRLVSLVWVFDRVVVPSGENVRRCGPVNVVILGDVPKFSDNLGRKRDVARGEEVLERVRGTVGVILGVGTRYVELRCPTSSSLKQ